VGEDLFSQSACDFVSTSLLLFFSEMTSKNDINSNKLGFALEILKLLAQKCHTKAELVIALGDAGFEAADLPQKISRTITKLRECGFDIECAPNRPYKLIESVFPVVLAQEQRQALAMAAHFLADMGFSEQASQIYRIGSISKASQPSNVTVDFHPPVDYSEDNISEKVELLQQRIVSKRRFVIWYRNNKGNESSFDLDKSELRLHNGVLYLFALVPSFRSWNIHTTPNADQNCTFRVDRIIRIGAASHIPWTYSHFPTVEICYRLSGALSNYQSRRPQEKVIFQAEDESYIHIQTQEDCLFWFRQRILQYGASAKVLSPDWFVKQIASALKKAYEAYGTCE
jgi:predicted DNA-binding transcriptional regulator YafY